VSVARSGTRFFLARPRACSLMVMRSGGAAGVLRFLLTLLFFLAPASLTRGLTWAGGILARVEFGGGKISWVVGGWGGIGFGVAFAFGVASVALLKEGGSDRRCAGWLPPVPA